jgi:uncharacterized protein (DUF697 family)
MNDYEMKAYDEVQAWQRKILKRSGAFSRFSKKIQTRINGYIPAKVQQAMTVAIKNMVKTTLTGSHLMTKKNQDQGLTLEEKDQKLKKKIDTYRKAAIVEGAGTGAGGIVLGLADFPLLLSIKIKFLFDTAAVYGFDTGKYEERMFILQIFKLAFSSDNVRRKTMKVIGDWDTRKAATMKVNWEEFQMEYRDYIDFAKMMQLVPGIGAAVGALVNNNLMQQLGEAAMNCYRLRLLTAPSRFV